MLLIHCEKVAIVSKILKFWYLLIFSHVQHSRDIYRITNFPQKYILNLFRYNYYQFSYCIKLLINDRKDVSRKGRIYAYHSGSGEMDKVQGIIRSTSLQTPRYKPISVDTTQETIQHERTGEKTCNLHLIYQFLYYTSPGKRRLSPILNKPNNNLRKKKYIYFGRLLYITCLLLTKRLTQNIFNKPQFTQ